MNNSYWRSILAVSVIAMTFICLGNAVTTDDLLVSARYLIQEKDESQMGEGQMDEGQMDEGQMPLPTAAGMNAGEPTQIEPNQPPSAGMVVPDKEGPQLPGNVIVWMGVASDPEGDRLLYQFWLNGPATGNVWKPMTNWSESNVWNWVTNPIDGGNNIIDMRVRDGYHAGPDSWDSHLSAEYYITNIESKGSINVAPHILSLKSDRQSPQESSVKVTWTTSASDPEGDTVLYQYWLKGPSTEEQWLAVTPWTTSKVWIWNTAQTRAGIYTIEARIRDGYHANAEGADDCERTPYVIKQTGIIK
jgi:hypothetical protein